MSGIISYTPSEVTKPMENEPVARIDRFAGRRPALFGGGGMIRMIGLCLTLALMMVGATAAHAEKLLLQMVGPSEIVGDLNDVDIALGTGLNMGALQGEFGQGANPGAGNFGTDFICFEMDLHDLTTGDVVGRGTDCLRFEDLSGLDNVIEGATLGVVAISFFDFGDGNVIVNKGLTTLQPFVSGLGDGLSGGDGTNGGTVTHLTGSIPGPKSDLAGGTGDYAGVKGFARVSGAVNAGTIDPPTGTGPEFNCLWEVNIED